MIFSKVIQRVPRPYSETLGGESAERFGDHPKEIRGFIKGVAGTSPYLKSLIDREHLWLNEMFSTSGDVLEQTIREITIDKNIPLTLRQAKRRIALWVALCDLAGAWSLEDVTGALSDFADHAVRAALNVAVQRQAERKKIPGFRADDNPETAGVFVLAMGKMGAGELNYSSDIDLICLFDDSRFDPADFHDARSAFIKATREMSTTLNDLTAEGYVFRTDLRLRPDPSVTPVCIGTDAAERYYESLGRTWERAAYIKARVCGGDLSAGSAFLKRMQPFVWRKHLDFTAIEDAHNMRLAIRDHKGLGGPITLEGHNMKLGRGGIREIEFFTQTRQLISGGRDPSLRERQTVIGLSKLAEQGWIGADVAQTLSDHYRAHRTVEHRLQMMHDAQTHSLPASEEGFARLACLMDKDEADLKKEIRSRLEAVHALTEGFFASSSHAGKQAPENEDRDESFENIVAGWLTYPALRSKRALKTFERLKPELIRRLKTAGKPQEAFIAFDGFLAGLPTGVQLFAMFEAFPKLIDLLIDIVASSPALAQYLSRNAQVFDAVIGGSFWDDWPGKEALFKDLSDRLGALGDYEAKLDATRRWSKEWHFRIGVHLLRGLLGAKEAARQYGELAEAVISGLWPEVIAQFATKHGHPPGRGAVVLGMGSLGLGRLHSSSDLDLIVIYDAGDADMSEGKRPLPSRQYYARLTQALVTAMTVPMAEGKLYEVDMRLRPSGNKGPVATSWSAFQSYQMGEAWIWEHLALSRARVIAGPQVFGQEVENFRISLMGQTPPEAAKRALSKMRLRIARAKGAAQVWEIKEGAGRLQDIEMMAQLGRLLDGGSTRDVVSGLQSAVRAGVLTEPQGAKMENTYALLWNLRVAAQLLGQSDFEEERTAEGAKRFVLALTDYPDLETLKEELGAKTEDVSAIIDGALPIVEDTHEEG